jgi:hypothetical protein
MLPRLALVTFLLAGCSSSATTDTGSLDRPPSDRGVDSPTQDRAASADGSEVDSDGDNLPDVFEKSFAGFDPAKRDSDGDGVADGDEDKDEDGLTAREEWAAWSLTAVETQRPSPLHKDLLVQMDYQQGRAPSSAALGKAIEAFAAVDLPNLDGKPGIALHGYFDEKDLPAADIQFATDAVALLGDHGPTLAPGGGVTKKMVHVIFVAAYPPSPKRLGETFMVSGQPPSKTGTLIYMDNLAGTYPLCGGSGVTAISVDEGLVSTLVHELGHTLQLGHDTEAGGGVNYFNVMAAQMPTCAELLMRTRGTGNTDPTLGATEAAGSARFSQAAVLLMKLRNKISVETSTLEVPNGYEM